jgi:hypothetical protein
MSDQSSNPFEFEYDEITDLIITKLNIKFFRDYENLDKKKQYVKINFSIYKIDKAVDWFTWLNEPDIETNYQIELFFELDIEFIKLLKNIVVNKNNIDNKTLSVQLEKEEFDNSWFNYWYLNSRFATDNIKLHDTYIPTTIEYIRFI